MQKKIFTLIAVIFSITFQVKAQSALDSGLVAYYPFNGNAGDSSYYGNHPSFNNATLTTDRFGNPNSAYRFNGTSSYMQIPNAPSLNMGTQLTMSLWVKPRGFYKGLCYNNMMISKGVDDHYPGNIGYYTFRYADFVNGCNALAVDTMQEYFYGPNNGVLYGNPIRLNKWYHLLFTTDGVTRKMYIDSKLTISEAAATTPFTNGYDLFFGKFNNASYPYWFNGDLDDIRIYNRGLSDSEVTMLHTDAPSFPIISGKVFIDVNSNGVMDGVDYPKANVRIDLSNGAYTFTDNSGNYEFFTDSIGAYTVTAQAPPFYTAAPTSTNYFFNTYTAQVINNIALQPNVVKDSLSINVMPLSMAATLGSAYPYWINYQNNGTTVLSPTVNLSYNNYMLIYDSCTDVVATPTASGMTTGQMNMAPGTQNNLIGYFTIKPTNNVGDTLQTTYDIAGGTVTNGGSFYTVIEAIPSNDGQRATPSLTQAQVAAGKDIIYTIGFRNTTNSNTLDVVIEDSLSSLLQPNTLQMVGSSHQCKTTVKGNRVLFELMDIKIPTAASNALKSYGYVSFSVKPKTTLVAGNAVVNKTYTSYNNYAPIAKTATTLIKPVVTPVILKTYNLKMTGDKQVLNSWTVATETNVAHYNITRSFDGKDFITVGKAKAGKNSYEFTDIVNNNFASVVYYRLEIIDNDGSKTYSAIKNISIGIRNNGVSIYPNPATNELNIIRTNATPEKVTLTDVVGRSMKTYLLSSSNATINIQDLDKGVYFLSFNNGERMKFVKQ